MSDQKQRQGLGRPRRWVIKIGSALLTDNGVGLDEKGIESWVRQISSICKQSVEIVLVSSGSVAVGMSRLGLKDRPSGIHELQAAAAVGQMGLIQTYERSFQAHDLITAQILLTHDDLSDRKRYLNARSTIETLITMGVVPIVNENDTVVTDEIRFGDNDTLGALVANLVDADGLVILTDQHGVYNRDPRSDPEAYLISELSANSPELDEAAGSGKGALGRGGMKTKISAARLAARSGAYTMIAHGKTEDVLVRLFQGESLGTLLKPDQSKQQSRKRWIAGHLQMKGSIVLDDGAVSALQRGGVSLLGVGVVSISGDFKRGEVVSCLDRQGSEVARGIINYGRDDAARLIGKASDQIAEILGFSLEPEWIHCDNIVLI